MNQRSSFRGKHRTNLLTAGWMAILITPPRKQTSNHADFDLDSTVSLVHRLFTIRSRKMNAKPNSY